MMMELEEKEVRMMSGNGNHLGNLRHSLRRGNLKAKARDSKALAGCAASTAIHRSIALGRAARANVKEKASGKAKESSARTVARTADRMERGNVAR